MKRLTFRVTMLLLLVLTELESSYQFGCPYVNFIDADNLEDLAVNEYMPQRIGSVNVLHHFQEADLPTMKIHPWIQNSFDSNIFRQIFEGKQFCLYLEAVKTNELECAVPPVTCRNGFSTNDYFRTYDGSCNNLENPGFGMAKSRYSRILRPNYGDGIYAPSKSSTGKALPNPRSLSLTLYGEDTKSDSHRTLMTMQFGQFIAHDISQLFLKDLPNDCCMNSRHKMCYPISLHPFGPIAMATGKTCLHFARSLSDKDVACPPSGLPYAEKITKTTAFLDLSSIYGNSLEQIKKIRLYKGGLLKASWFNNQPYLPIKSSECPGNNEECYSIPDNRNQFTPLAAVLHTVFVREHNRLASILAGINPQYSDERIFQDARKINIAQFQKIAYYDWIPLVLGPTYSFNNGLIYPVSDYDYVNDYNPHLNPAPFAEFSAGAMRYFHHIIPGWFSMVSPGRNTNQTMRLSDYFESQNSMQLLMTGNNFDSLIRGLVTQLEKRADGNIDPEIKHNFDRKPYVRSGTDLKSVDIQRSRDFGLPSYNDVREYCGLRRAYQWSGFYNEIPSEKVEVLKKFYDSPNDVELIIGGGFEKHVPNSILGPTFQCIIGKQFLKTRAADRLFYENEKSGFSKGQLAEIRKISLASILCANSYNVQCIQQNVFAFPNHQNSFQKCSDFPQLDFELWRENCGV